jgi:uncharacterized membrane protein YccF (DUF307 family)
VTAERPIGAVIRFVLNVPWLALSGFWMFLVLWPFGRTVVTKPGAGLGSGIGNVFWVLLSGVWLAIGHVVIGVLLCITSIGIPLGLANFELIPVSLLPLGKDIVPTGSAAAASSSAVVGPQA